MAGEARVEKWVRRILSDPMMTNNGERKCTAIALMHVTSGLKSEIHTQKLGSRTHEPKQLADMFNGLADEHSAGLSSSESGSGQEMYQLVAFYDDLPEMARSPLPITRRTGPDALPDDPIVTEPPNAKGELAQSMRNREAWMQFSLEMTARNFAAQSMIIDTLSKRLSQAERENLDTMELAKDMVLEKAANVHGYAMAEKEYERKTEERKRLMQIAPPLVNQLLGKEFFPNSVVDSSILEGLIESADEAQLSKLIEVVLPILKPEQAGLLMGRMTQIQEAFNARKAKASALAKEKQNGSGGQAS